MADTLNLLKVIRKFTADRGWGKYHKPKDLMLKLMEEVGELGEHFQWREDDDIKARLDNAAHRQAVEDEAMDVLIVLLMVIDYLDCDIEKAFMRKIQKNALKYPVQSGKKNKTKLSSKTGKKFSQSKRMTALTKNKFIMGL